MSGDIIYISSKYRPKNDPISREIHIWYKLRDDEKNLDFKRNCQNQ